MSDIHELTGLYVVDALTPDETREFKVHLASCAACQEEVARLRNVTEQLSRTVAAEPPATLRASVLAEIAATPQEPATATATAAAAPGPEPPNADVVALSSRRPSRLPYLVAAASVLLALAFGGWALQSREDARQATEQQSEILQVVEAPDAHTVSGTTADGGAGTVVVSQSSGRAIFVANGMAALPGDQVYELWTIEGAPVPAGTFTSDGATSVVTLPDAALSANTIAVTVEPAGGSEQPTTEPILALPLT